MSLNAATLKLMADKGLSLDDVVEIAAAMESRSSGAERQKRYRDKRRNERDVTRDVTPVPPIEELLTPSGTELPDEASASSPVRQPVTEAFGIWNEAAAIVGWPQARSLTPGRQKSISSRLRDHGLDGWKAAIARARASPFLAGPDPPSWFTLDFLIKAGNFVKVIEGNYDRRNIDNSDPTTVALQRLHALSGGFGAGA